MATVYLAEDQELGRRVAIKTLDERHAQDEQFVERFRREAKSAAVLSHPNIVAVYDRGQSDGTYYIAMEYLEGKTLKELLVSRGATPVRIAVDYARQILAALEFAHRNAIVHRDIKPHNVDRRARRSRQGHGLRDRPLRLQSGHGGRLDHRHRPVPVSRAGARRARRSPGRHLFDRDRALRDVDRQRPVRGRNAARGGDAAPLRGSRGPFEEPPGHPARARRDRPAGYGEGPGAAIQERAGHGRRPRAVRGRTVRLTGHRGGRHVGARRRRSRRRGHGRHRRLGGADDLPAIDRPLLRLRPRRSAPTHLAVAPGSASARRSSLRVVLRVRPDRRPDLRRCARLGALRGR